VASEDRHQVERKGLKLSVWGALGMAALGFGFAAATGSDAVLLDGVFSLVNFAVGILALRVASLVQMPDDERFHFGYAAYEPMLNLAKGLLMAVVSLMAMGAALLVVIAGGREIQGGIAVVYALLAGAGCFAVALGQRRAAHRTGSPLLVVDARNWLVDGLMSAAVAVAFGVVVMLRGTTLEWLLPYADPAIVILLVVLSAPIPLAIIRANWGQLLGRAPAADDQRAVREAVAAAVADTPVREPHIRLLETGRFLYVQVYLVVDPDPGPVTISDLDAVRTEVTDALMAVRDNLGVDVVFTADAAWVRRTVAL